MKIPNFDYGWLDNWILSEPGHIIDMVREYPPDDIYTINTGQVVVLNSYFDDGTISVISVTDYPEYPAGLVIFGINPLELKRLTLSD